jgi:hypothetical protein
MFRSYLKNPFVLSLVNPGVGHGNAERPKLVIARRQQGRRGDLVAHGFSFATGLLRHACLSMTAVLFVESRHACAAVEA